MRSNWIFYTFLLVLLVPGLATAAFISEELQERLEAMQEGDRIPVNVVLKAQATASQLEALKYGLDKDSARTVVSDYLKELARSEQMVLLAYLEEMQQEGRVSRVKPLWIANCISIVATDDVIRKCATFPEVDHVWLNVKKKVLLEDDRWRRLEKPVFEPSRADTAWGVKWIRAHEAWDMYGVKGEAALVGILDTGCDYNHPDLVDRVWNNPGETPDNGIDDDGNGYVDDYYGYDFGSHDSNPYDDYGHGTHVAGTVGGDGSAGTLTGVAPATTMQILKVLEYGYGDEADVWEGIEYCVDNGTTNATGSIGWIHMYHYPDRATWRTICENAVAAGVALTFAGGNERNWYGPPYDIRTPADVPCVMAIGATGYKTDYYAYFSSEGPTYWDDYPYPPGLVKPDICAPGENVNSTTMGGGYSGDTWDGTSMATPHVAGLIALMVTANPAIGPTEIRECLETTAIDLGPTGMDNDYGWGRVDAVEALGCVGGASGLRVFVEDYPGVIQRGEVFECTIGVENIGEEDIEYFDQANVVVSGPASTTLGIYNGADIPLAPGATRTAPFSFRIPSGAPTGHYFLAFTVYLDGAELDHETIEVVVYM